MVFMKSFYIFKSFYTLRTEWKYDRNNLKITFKGKLNFFLAADTDLSWVTREHCLSSFVSKYEIKIYFGKQSNVVDLTL